MPPQQPPSQSPSSRQHHLTGAQIKHLYESQPDTNEFTDAEKQKLGELGTTEALTSRTNHTGTQPIESIEGLASALAGLEPADPTILRLADVGPVVRAAGAVSWNELADRPSLGSAASADVLDLATAAQGALAESAVQPADLVPYETSAQLDARDAANRSRTNHTGPLPPTHTFGSAWIANPTDTVVPLFTAAHAFTINGIRGLATSAGSLTVAIQINGVTVGGLGALVADSTYSSNLVSATANNTGAAGSRVVAVVSGLNNNPKDLEFTLDVTLS